MQIDVRIAQSVEQVGQSQWNMLGQSQPFASYRWYRFAETVLNRDVPLYVILSQGDTPVARATFWIKRQEPLPIPSRGLRRVTEAILQRWPLMVCRTPLASTTGLVLPNSPLRNDALRLIVENIDEIGRNNRTSFILFDYLASVDAEDQGWPDNVNRARVPDPGTRLDIVWDTFDDYVRSRRKTVRKDYRRHCNRAQDLGIVVERHTEVPDIDESLVLIRSVEAHHGSAPNPTARAMLENTSMVDAEWLSARIGEKEVGCGLVLGDGDACFLALLGLDYGVRYAYFQLVYAAIECAIDRGARVLRGGGGAYDLKRRLGFEIEDDNSVVFCAGGRVFERLGGWVVTAAQDAGGNADEL